MLALLVELQALPDQRESLVLCLTELTRKAAEEPGIHAYAAQVCEEDANRFFLYEVYQDRQAWEAHLAHPPAKALLDQLPALLAQPPRLLFGERWASFVRPEPAPATTRR